MVDDSFSKDVVVLIAIFHISCCKPFRCSDRLARHMFQLVLNVVFHFILSVVSRFAFPSSHLSTVFFQLNHFKQRSLHCSNSPRTAPLQWEKVGG